MIVNFFFVFGSLIEFAVVNNATGNEAAAEKNLSQEVSEKIGPQENNNFNLVSNEVTPNHLGGAGLNSTTAFSGSEKSPNREATELLAEENLSVMSTPYGQNVRNQKLLGASANQKTRSRTSIAKPLAFIPRLFKKKDIDDISKVSFPCSFILWHAIFIVLGHRALEGQEHLWTEIKRWKLILKWIELRIKDERMQIKLSSIYVTKQNGNEIFKFNIFFLNFIWVF